MCILDVCCFPYSCPACMVIMDIKSVLLTMKQFMQLYMTQFTRRSAVKEVMRNVK